MTVRPEEAGTATATTTVIARMTEAMTVTVAEEMKTDSTEVLIGIGIPVTNTIREREEEIDMTIVTEEMMTRRDMTTVIGERTATAAVMTESAGLGAMIEDIAAETVTVGATVTATVATGRPAFNCTLMAGVALLMSLVVGRIWIMESETHQSRSIRSARPELPVHMNLLLCPS